MQDFQSVGYLPSTYSHWIRQSEKAREALVERVYQISKASPGQEPLVIASCGKAAAQRLIAALAERGGPDKYKVSVFLHPTLPGMEIER